MPLKPITPQTTDRFCGLVVAPAGMGKTSLLRTILGQEYNPETRSWVQVEEPTHKVLTLSAESGLLCVRELVNAGLVQGYEIGSLQDFREALTQLMLPDCQQNYQWVFIDSLTEISGRCVEAMKLKHPGSGDGFKLWGEYNDTMTQLIKAFRDMPHYNVIFTCLESTDTDENKRRFVAPAISGREVKERLTSYFDEVFRMVELPDANGAIGRYFHTAQPVGLAKDRSGKLDPVEYPNLLRIQRKILAGPQPPEARA